MRYKCSPIDYPGLVPNSKKIANVIDAEMARMASQGWRLVSTSTFGGSNPFMFLFWEAD